MATAEALDRCVIEAIQKERQRVKQIRKSHPEKKHRITDYASIVVAGGYARNVSVFPAKSASPINYQYVDAIKVRLERLGDIGGKRRECKNIIGACAEPHAADKVLKEFPRCHMNELQFSAAYRPRTAKRKKYCRNCRDTFPEVL